MVVVVVVGGKERYLLFAFSVLGFSLFFAFAEGLFDFLLISSKVLKKGAEKRPLLCVFFPHQTYL